MKSVVSILLLVLLGVVIAFAFEITLPNQPLQGGCGTGWIAKDESAPFEYNGDQVVCKVIVKAGSQGQEDACYGFKFPPANQTDGCYNVNGLGSNSVRVTGGGSGPECKEISHVEFYKCPVADTPTSTPTSPPVEKTATPSLTPIVPTGTNTPAIPVSPSPTPTTPTGTPAKTELLPTDTSTSEGPTPSQTSTPVGPTPTQTSTSEGPTPTQTVGTGTSTWTASPPKPKRTPTGTGLVLLPATGIRGTDNNDGGAWFGIIVVAIFVFTIMIKSVVKARRQ